MRKRLVGTILAAVGAAAWPGGVGTQAVRGEDSGRPVPSYVHWWGAHSRIDAAEYSRIRTEEDWKKLWTRHAGEVLETPYKIAKYPVVDFERCEVLAVFAGKTMNTRGLALAGLVEEADRVLLRFDRTSRSYQSGPEGDEVTPFLICVVPRTDKAVVVEEDVHDMKGDAPRWKERARLE
jgi:hypothetical protein